MDRGGEINVLPLTYLGNIQYFSKLCFSECVIDTYENYVKQSYRSRCDILSAEGRLSLSINVAKPHDGRRAVRDTRIDYSQRWQHLHWRAMVSAYRNSPYFDFYEDFFAPFYECRYEFLMDFNLELQAVAMKLLGCTTEVKLSDKYVDTTVGNFIDLRDSLSPKPRLARADAAFVPAPYRQVFEERTGFVPNLSIVDLLFCEGPNARDVLRASVL
jgi:hypothetical protein